MGPPRRGAAGSVVVADVPSGTVVFRAGKGSNVVDVDGNRYVDLAAGFGALLLGHGHPSILRVLSLQAPRLLQALGDVHPSDAKIALMERLSALHPAPGAQVILGQSGADAVTAALKTAVLATGRPGVLAFRGAYHGLSYAPLSLCGLRDGYRDPFVDQLSSHVKFAEYPANAAAGARTLEQVSEALRQGTIGGVVIEPILGRGGCIVPPPGFLTALAELTRERGALFVADEIWTGLGRSGAMLRAVAEGVVPDLVCLGKGLGGGLPISACIGTSDVMASWRRDPEVVHTSTFAGAPLACAAAIATLDTLSRERLVARSAEVGERWIAELGSLRGEETGVVDVRGAGFMVGIDLGARPSAAARVQGKLLSMGWVVSSGGGNREVLVLTPALNAAEPLLVGVVPALREAFRSSL
jgi:4-aminobutyrate aminotransferase/(S)-3-amino-2-methylpropionate transaminase